jgi:hypothetical protein
MKAFLSLILLFLFTSCHPAAIASGGSGFSMSEDFDGSSSCGISSYSNCNVTGWAVDPYNNVGIQNLNYSTSPAPLNGSSSMYVNVGSENAHGSCVYQTLPTATSPVYAFWEMNIGNLGVSTGYNTVNVYLFDASANSLANFIVTNPSGTRYAGIADQSTNNASSFQLTQGTTYYVWMDYTKGTGSNAIYHLYINNAPSKPGSPTLTVSTGTSTADVSYVDFCAWNSTGYISDSVVYDHIRISSSPTVDSFDSAASACGNLFISVFESRGGELNSRPADYELLYEGAMPFPYGSLSLTDYYLSGLLQG